MTKGQTVVVPKEPPMTADKASAPVDALAQEIRRVDGNNSLGAGALAEALMPFLSARLSADLEEARGERDEADAVIRAIHHELADLGHSNGRTMRAARLARDHITRTEPRHDVD